MNSPSGHRIGIVGAGVMGTGIAALMVGNGLPVALIDNDEEALKGAEATVDRHVRTARLMRRLPRDVSAGELRVSGSMDDVTGATVIIEAVVEVPGVKHAVWAAITSRAPAGTLLISNTSAIPIGELAHHAGRPEDLVGVHFMNPATLITGVEVIRGDGTSDVTVDAARALLADLGLKATVVRDGPGFVINRILQRSINDAARLVADGVAGPQQIDDLFVQCLGHRTGPLATADLIGLDNVVQTLTVLRELTGDASYEPCELLVSHVDAGSLGRKSGNGFYRYEGTTS